MKKAKVISAFPACGKSYYYKNLSSSKIVLDSDSSEFSWIEKNGEKVRNPEFPNNYINHIRDNLSRADIIFVSSHEVVRDGLRNNGIDYSIVYPDKSLKSIWKQRFIDRGNPDSFIKFIMDNWDNFINDIEKETFPIKIKLKGDQYMSDVLPQIK